MNPTQHVLTRVDTGGKSYAAQCLCGFSSVSYNRQKAVANLYSHVIHASKPVCPTPKKKAYPNQVHAENAIRNYILRPTPGARPARAYQCPSGQHWHTTKNVARERRIA
ncbi:hypothetical protein [Nocardia xishanensis]|uniref:hypothetical protein n=1 Tax=Nocardia xishanensis TaxID=238964 RepID=UPI000829BAC7|nr:hypothetical protein [Nocardia xishanensis]